MIFSVTIESFEGPLDLMLYLIKEKKLDLFNLDITELTNQYIDYIHEMQRNSLEIASEYLSELAGLIEYKSKKLLPRDTSELDANEPHNEEESLVRRLLEYQKFKEISQQLSELYNQRQYEVDIPSTYQTMIVEDDQPIVIKNDIYDLIKAMSRLMVRQQQLNQSLEVQVTQKELSVDERIDQIRHYLNRQTDSFNILEIMRPEYSLQLQIVTFLAVLDMIRMNELFFHLGSDDSIILKGV